MKRNLLLLLALCALPFLSTGQTLIHTEDMETDDEGVNYRTNVHDDGNDDLWKRYNADSFPQGPNTNFWMAYTGHVGSYVFGGEDFQSPDNPLGSTESAYFTIKTLDVSTYAGGSMEVRAYMGCNSDEINRYESGDAIFLEIALDGDISTGANSVGGLPVMDSLVTGTYSIVGAFYGGISGSGSDMIRDDNLDGSPDAGSDTLTQTMKEITFNFSIPSGASNMSIRFRSTNNAGSEEFVLDHIRVFASNSVTPVVASIADSTNVSCNGGSDGSLVAEASLGAANYTYTWSNGTIDSTSATFDTLTGLSAGVYTVTITDVAGNTSVASATLTQPSQLNLTTTSSIDPSCPGSTDGSIGVLANGGTSAYSFSWSNGASDPGGSLERFQSWEATSADNWNFTAFPATYNTEGDSIIDGSDDVWAVLQEFTFDIDTSSHGLYFWGGQDLNNPNGGGFFYHTITFDAVALNSSAAHTLSFDYFTDGYDTSDSLQYQVKFDNGTTWDTTGIELVKNTQAWITETIQIPAGNTFVRLRFQARQDGSSDFVGFDNVRLTSSTSTNSGLAAGTYTVTLTDANGCTATATNTLSVSSSFSASASVDQNVTCNGQSDGGATASASGGTSPYTFNWNTGATTATVTGLAAGTYSVTVSDASGCTDSTSVTITEPTALVASIASSSNVTTSGGSDGSATAAGTGGTSPYTFLWSNATTSATTSNLSAGTYSVTLTDANGCTDSASVTITQPTSINLSTSVTNVPCNGDATGAINLTASGGSTPYTFLWSNTATSQNLTNIAAGAYTVTVTDNSGNTSTASATVTEPTAINATATTSTNVSCNGFVDGSAIASATGGTSPYTFAWNTGATSASVTGLFAGTFTVTITDNNGCTATASTTVTQPSALVATATVDSNSTCGLSNGGATSAGTGGTQPYTYAWSNAATTASITGVASGTYSVTVTDANGCTDSASVTISSGSLVSISIGVFLDPSCPGFIDGGATTVTSGGTTPYTYNWSNSLTTSSINSQGAGTYTVTVTDANGCTDTTSVTLTDPAPLSITGVVTDVSCNGLADGEIDATITGGTAPYTYAWSNLALTEDLTGLMAGTFTLGVIDGNGCSATSTPFLVSEPPAISVTATVTSDESCIGGFDGSANATPVGGVMPYTFDWSNGASGNLVFALTAGTYTVTLTDSNGCTANTSINVIQVDSVAPVISCPANITTTADSITCEAMVTFSVTSTDNCPGDTLILLAGLPSGSPFPIGVTTVSYVAVDVSGNTDSCSFTVTVNDPNPIAIATDPISASVCEGDDVTLVVSVIGNPMGYQWRKDGTDISGANSNSYTISGVTQADAGDYDVVVEGTCVTLTSGIATLTVIPAPVPNLGNDTSICQQDSLVLNPGNFASYLWSDGSTGSTFVVGPGVANTADTVSVEVVDANGCVGSAQIVVQYEICLGIGQIGENSRVQFFPNPTRGQLTLLAEGITEGELLIEFRGLDGRLVSQQRLVTNGQVRQDFNLTELSAGVYLVRLQTATGSRTERIVIE